MDFQKLKYFHLASLLFIALDLSSRGHGFKSWDVHISEGLDRFSKSLSNSQNDCEVTQFIKCIIVKEVIKYFSIILGLPDTSFPARDIMGLNPDQYTFRLYKNNLKS